MVPLVATKMFFTRGVGTHNNKLQSFELALRDAKIAPYNLVKVSSILPAGCRIIPRNRGVAYLRPGQIVFCVLAHESTNEPNRLVSAGVGLAVPSGSESRYGYISEHHGFGMTEKKTADFVEDMAASMLASTLGLDLDPDAAYDARRDIYRMSGEIVKTRATVQSAEGHKDGKWTTVVSAAIMIVEDSDPTPKMKPTPKTKKRARGKNRSE